MDKFTECYTGKRHRPEPCRHGRHSASCNAQPHLGWGTGGRTLRQSRSLTLAEEWGHPVCHKPAPTTTLISSPKSLSPLELGSSLSPRERWRYAPPPTLSFGPEADTGMLCPCPTLCPFHSLPLSCRRSFGKQIKSCSSPQT